MVSYGIPMDSYGFLWIPMDSYGFLWIPIVMFVTVFRTPLFCRRGDRDVPICICQFLICFPVRILLRDSCFRFVFLL
jgi:hypothetical protein